MPAPPSSKQQQSIKSPANTKSKTSGSGTSTSWGGSTAKKSGTGGGGLLSQAQSKGKSGYSPGSGGTVAHSGMGGGGGGLLNAETRVQGGQGVQAYDSRAQSYSNPATYSVGTPFGTVGGAGGRSTAFKGMNLSPADMLRGGYGAYQQPPGTPQTAAEAPRPIRRVTGGKGVQAYSPLSTSYSNPPVFTEGIPFKEQARVQPQGYNPGGYSQMAFGAPQAPISPMAGQGQPGFGPTSAFADNYDMGKARSAYDRFATGNMSQVAPMNGGAPQGSGSETFWGGYPEGESLYTGEGMVPESTNPVTNTARKIAEKLSGPLAKADSALGRMFPGMEAYTPQPPFGSSAGNGQSPPWMLGVEKPKEDLTPKTPPGTGTTPPPPAPAVNPLLYPQYYTQGAWARLPTGAYLPRTI